MTVAIPPDRVRPSIWRNDRSRKSLHLLVLRAALQQEQIDARGLELVNPLDDALRRADETRAKAPVRHRVVLERQPLLELRVRDPLMIIAVAGGGLLHVSNAVELGTRLPIGVSCNGVR